MGDMIPAACPRCGSDDPNRHLRVTNGWDHVYCDDEWHVRPTAACPRCGSTDPAVRLLDWSNKFGGVSCGHDWHDLPTGADPYPCAFCGEPMVPGLGHKMGAIPGQPVFVCENCGAEARTTGADDLAAAPLVTRIWQVLDDHGMGVVRKADMEALTARLWELEAVEDDRVWLRAELDDAIRIGNDLRIERDRLREAGDALAVIVEDRASITPDYAALNRWEQVR